MQSGAELQKCGQWGESTFPSFVCMQIYSAPVPEVLLFLSPTSKLALPEHKLMLLEGGRTPSTPTHWGLWGTAGGAAMKGLRYSCAPPHHSHPMALKH